MQAEAVLTELQPLLSSPSDITVRFSLFEKHHADRQLFDSFDHHYLQHLLLPLKSDFYDLREQGHSHKLLPFTSTFSTN